MKLGKLNAAIRAHPKIKVRYSFGDVAQEKASLLEALRLKHNGERGAETGLMVTEDGYLTWDR